MVVYNRDSSGNWVASESGQSAASLGYGSSGKSSSTTKSTTTQSTSTTPSSSTSSEKSYTYTSPTTGKTSTTTDYRHSDAAKAADAANRAAASGGGSTTQKSPPSSGNSISTSSPSPGSLTVQPTYISGGKGGNTYIITYSDGTQNQIAASGQSLADSAKYYQEKADQAAAKGNTSQAAKYQKSANEFAAAANYEKESGVTNTYGTTTGKTYDATASIYLNESGTGVKVADTALEYKAGYGVTDSHQATTLTAKEVSTKLGESLQSAPKPAVTTTLTGSGNNSAPLAVLPANTPLQISGTASTSGLTWYAAPETLGTSQYSRYNSDGTEKGIPQMLFENIGNNIGSLTSATASGGLPGLWSGLGSLVDGYVESSNWMLEQEDPVIHGMGIFNTIASTPDLFNVSKKLVEGKADELSPTDYAFAGLDALTFTPVVGLIAGAVKSGKAAKTTAKTIEGIAEPVKTPGKASDEVLSLIRTGDGASNTVEEMTKFEKISDTPDALAGVQKGSSKGIGKVEKVLSTGSYVAQGALIAAPIATGIIKSYLEDDDPNQGDNGDDGNKDATIDLNEKPQKIWDDNPYHWEYNPDEQRPYSEQDISDILSAALAGLSGSQTSGGAGGGGDITIVNETPAASGNSSDWFEQIKPYIIPALIAIVIIALIAFSGNDKKTKSKGVKS